MIQWKGAADPDAQPLAFVGKGVCFDTGGISLKPADGMEDMKWDMGGAAAVAGLMHVLAARKAKVNVVGILGLVENMPDGAAQRPGDIVTSMSGQTIEVINTDAEGRLVLADALWYCQDRFKPKFMIDLATLTGAIVIALGDDYAGLFSNDDDLGRQAAGGVRSLRRTLWRMPLPRPTTSRSTAGGRHEEHRRPARPARSPRPCSSSASSTACPGPTSTSPRPPGRNRRRSPTIPEGATGFGVRLLNQLVADSYERMSEPACDVWFYHLERTTLDQALPELLEKTLARGWRAARAHARTPSASSIWTAGYGAIATTASCRTDWTTSPWPSASRCCSPRASTTPTAPRCCS